MANYPTEDITFRNNYLLLQEAIRKAQDMVFVKNTNLEYVAVSDSFARMVGKSPRSIIGKQDYDVFEDNYLAEKYRLDDKNLMEGRQNIYNMVEPIPDAEGKPQYASTSKELLIDREGNILGIMGVSTDSDKLRSAQQHFQTEMQGFLELDENDCYVLIVDVNEWKVLDRKVNPKFHVNLSTDLDLDQIVTSARTHINAEATEALDFYNQFSAQYLREIYTGGKSQVVLEYLHDLVDNNVQWMQDIINLRTNPENGHLFAILLLHSVDEQRQKALRLRHEAETDGLTGLLNRHYFILKCKKFLDDEGACGKHAFFMIDVDNFKRINDTFGHQAGDHFLESLASVLQLSFREDDLIARIGGDEFVVLMKNILDEELVEDRVRKIVEKTKATINQYEGVVPSISVGISLYPGNGTNVEELYGNADIALYKAKQHRNNCFQFYEEPDNI